jgi:hypothetical protein
MRRYPFTRVLAAKWCLLMLSILLLLSACGGSSNPGSQPNGTPQPTNGGGYSLISLFNQEINFFLAP